MFIFLLKRLVPPCSPWLPKILLRPCKLAFHYTRTIPYVAFASFLFPPSWCYMLNVSISQRNCISGSWFLAIVLIVTWHLACVFLMPSQRNNKAIWAETWLKQAISLTWTGGKANTWWSTSLTNRTGRASSTRLPTCWPVTCRRGPGRRTKCGFCGPVKKKTSFTKIAQTCVLKVLWI